MSIGYTLPFIKASGSIGYFETTRDEISATRENLKSILLTNWGERVNHYNFGCDFRRLLFENIAVDELKQKFADRIISQVERWLPTVQLKVLNIFLHEDDKGIPDNCVRVSLVFVLNQTDRSGRLDILVTP